MKPKITNKTTRFRLPITPEEKLDITLRFLVTGETNKGIMYQHRVCEVSISRFMPEVCQVIIESFMEEYMSLPDFEGRNLKRNSSSQVVLEQSMGGMFP